MRQVVAVAVADGDVEVAIVPELQIPTDVMARGGWDVVEQHSLAGGIDPSLAGENESRYTVDRSSAAEPAAGEIDVHEPVGTEPRIDGEAHESAFALMADVRREVE